MTEQRAACLVGFLAVVLTACLPSTAAEDVLLAGDVGGVWVAVKGDDGWRLASRAVEAKDWEKPWPQEFARVEALAASGDGAVLFFETGDLVRCFPGPSKTMGVKASRDLWPEGSKMLAACPGVGGGANPVLVLLSRAAVEGSETRPASAPAADSQPAPATQAAEPAPAAQDLSVLRYAGQGWEELGRLPWRGPVPERSFIAALAGNTYVLLGGPSPQLWALAGGAWIRVDLPEMEAAETVAGLVALESGDGAVLAAFDAGSRRLRIAARRGGQWSPFQPVRLAAEAKPWPGEAPPAMARFGASKLALLWRQDGELMLGRCGLDGHVAAAPVKAFEQAAPGLSPEMIQQAWLVVILLVGGAVILLGPRDRRLPFSLPPTMAPAPAGKRAMAFLLDIVPFLFVGAAFFDVPEGFDIWRILGGSAAIPVEVFYLQAFVTVAYTVYATLMEIRFGATLGKKLLRLRIVGDGGAPPTVREVVLRNIVRIVEMAVVLIPAALILLTRYRQRLGDRIAWTAVIDISLPPQQHDAGEQAPPPVPGDNEDRSDQEEKL